MKLVVVVAVGLALARYASAEEALTGLGAGAGQAAETGGGAFRCELVEGRGLSAADAATAAELLCDQIRRASSGRGKYTVRLTTLGSTVILEAGREQPIGSLTVRLDGIGEIAGAAPRIADALVHDKPLATTQRVDNLLEAETRTAPTKKGSLKFTVGVADVESPGWGARATGFSLGLMHATPSFALPAEFRFAWGDSSNGEKDLQLVSFSVGGRGYLSKRNTSPFLGGGLSILGLSATEYDSPTSHFDGHRTGVAPYLEGGVEMLRLHRARVSLLLRADFPTGSLTSPETVDWNSRNQRVLFPAQSRYVVPLTIGVNLAF
jgi:hypothetical protein